MDDPGESHEPHKPSEQVRPSTYCESMQEQELRLYKQHPPPGYRFCLLNEQVFERILSFLSNQAQVKLQGITGDVYPNSQPKLARLCCPCEEDNPAMVAGLCTRCEEEKNPLFNPLMRWEDAKILYGGRNMWRCVPLRSVRTRGSDHHVARADAERYMLERCGSKMRWLKLIASRNVPQRKLVAKQVQKRAEYEAALRTLPRECATYVSASEEEHNAAALKGQAERFSVMTAALHARGLQLRDDSQLCRRFIMKGEGSVDEAVDTMEDMAFLHAHTDCYRRQSAKIRCFQRFKNYRGGSGWGDEADEATFGTLGEVECGAYYLAVATIYEQHRHIRNYTKRELLIEYLCDDRGFILPRKWKSCRERYDHIISVGAMPKQFMNYIYTGEGKPPQAVESCIELNVEKTGPEVMAKQRLEQCDASMEALKIADEENATKLVAGKIENKAEYEAFLRSVSQECASYVQGGHISRIHGLSTLQERAERFSIVTEALQARGLQLREDSQLCRHYIMKGRGDIDEIVDTMEEMAFLHSHTQFAQRCSAKISCMSRFKSYRGGLGWGDDSDESTFGTLGEAECGACYLPNANGSTRKQHIRENTKKELCIEFLQDDHGLTLPRLWEACRDRYNYVVSIGATPKQFMHHIYTDAGEQPKRPKAPRKLGRGKTATST